MIIAMIRLVREYRAYRLRRQVAQAAVNYFGGLEAFAAECERKRRES